MFFVPSKGQKASDNVFVYRLLSSGNGGAREDRTPDPLRARQVLSQLSYGPGLLMVGLRRFELLTSPLSGVRSNQLSYRPRLQKKQFV